MNFNPDYKMSLADKEFWKIVENAQWMKDHNPDRVKEEFQLLPKERRNQLKEFIEFKIYKLYLRYENEWLGDPGIPINEDSFSHLLSEVVGRGEAFYNSINFKTLQEIALNFDFAKSFENSVKFADYNNEDGDDGDDGDDDDDDYDDEDSD